MHFVICIDIDDGEHKSESSELALSKSPVADALPAPLEFGEDSITQGDWIMSVAALLLSSHSTVSSMGGKELLRCR